MSNLIERKAISDLLTGGYFYIPSYQRGYRWTPTQVTQLLRDLFSYANEPHGTSTTNLEGDYYCLQPVVARLMTNEKVLKRILPEGVERSEDNPVWEIIDGQQRLTTIYILYKYLMTKEGISERVGRRLWWQETLSFGVCYQKRFCILPGTLGTVR